MIEKRSIALGTGVSLDVAVGGPEEGEPIIFLHGFPESHRTWRHQLADLSRDHFVIAPDQRGYAGSDKPPEIEEYATDKIVADVFALADELGIDRFTLVGHDWGGAAAWLAALTDQARVKRLVIVNAPHPLVFARSLAKDGAQRAASQYVRAFRDPRMEQRIGEMGLGAFYEKNFGRHADLSKIPDEERTAYITDWSRPGALTAMLNWYRASKMEVPAVGEAAEAPAWTQAEFPKLMMPVLVIWGLQDQALLPEQLDGLDALIGDLRIVTSATGGHFIPWEEPEIVNSAIRDFVVESAKA